MRWFFLQRALKPCNSSLQYIVDARSLHWFENMFAETLDEFLKYKGIISGSVGYRAVKHWKTGNCSSELSLNLCPYSWTLPKAQQRWDMGLYTNLSSDLALLVLCSLCTNQISGLREESLRPLEVNVFPFLWLPWARPHIISPIIAWGTTHLCISFSSFQIIQLVSLKRQSLLMTSSFEAGNWN